MRRLILGLLGAFAITLASGSQAAVQRWQEGEHFVRLPRPTADHRSGRQDRGAGSVFVRLPRL